MYILVTRQKRGEPMPVRVVPFLAQSPHTHTHTTMQAAMDNVAITNALVQNGFDMGDDKVQRLLTRLLTVVEGVREDALVGTKRKASDTPTRKRRKVRTDSELLREIFQHYKAREGSERRVQLGRWLEDFKEDYDRVWSIFCGIIRKELDFKRLPPKDAMRIYIGFSIQGLINAFGTKTVHYVMMTCGYFRQTYDKFQSREKPDELSPLYVLWSAMQPKVETRSEGENLVEVCVV